MEAFFAYSVPAYNWPGSHSAGQGWAEIAPTFYSVGIVFCCALLILWWGVVRPRR